MSCNHYLEIVVRDVVPKDVKNCCSMDEIMMLSGIIKK